jgi:hypothetical protein
MSTKRRLFSYFFAFEKRPLVVLPSSTKDVFRHTVHLLPSPQHPYIGKKEEALHRPAQAMKGPRCRANGILACTRNEYMSSLPQGMTTTIATAGSIVVAINIALGQMYLTDDVDPHEVFECGASEGTSPTAQELGILLPAVQLLLVFELEV